MLQQRHNTAGSVVFVKNANPVAFFGGKGTKGQAAQTGTDDGNFHGKHSFIVL
jgi:hypothetical protein